MDIVILDGYTTNPGDLSWDSLSNLGNLTVYNSTAEGEITSRAKNAEVIVMCRVPMSRETLKALPKLRLITTLATGYNTIDLETCAELDITVCNVPFYCIESVSQSVFSLLFELCCHTSLYSSEVKNGNWQGAVDMNYRQYPLFELSGKTFGIFGFGNIGQNAAKIASAFGMSVIYHSRTPKKDEYDYVDFETLLKESDILSIHCPLTEETTGRFSFPEFSAMKESAYLINTARGAITDENALADALNKGIIAGAGLDVMTDEPPKASNPLLGAKNCVITPHISWASREARSRLINCTADNIKSFAQGNIKNKII